MRSEQWDPTTSPIFGGAFVDTSLESAADAKYSCENDQGTKWCSGLKASTPNYSITHDPDGTADDYLIVKPDGKIGLGAGITAAQILWDVTIRQKGLGNDGVEIFGDQAGLVIHNAAGVGSGVIAGGGDVGRVHSAIALRDTGISDGSILFGTRKSAVNNDLDISAQLTETQFIMTNFGAGVAAHYMEVIKGSLVPTATGGSYIPIYGWSADSTLRAKIDGVEEIILTDTKDPDLKSGVVYKVNGTQVVGARLAAVASPTADVASLKIAVDAIRDRLRATGGHGLNAD